MESNWRKSSYSSDQGGECATSAQLAWRKSTHSSDQGGDCVEIAEAPPTIAIRDSKNPTGPILTITPAAFHHFVSWSGATPAV
ncbi:DUF397 domain-containing protein [Streptomyces sp. NBC_00019]|uniref:DUF397 domain-containing protein n=1 Tax=Streptomyces sp. NBC_00019 TaxID=2975623 RepID=UPI0032462B99